MVDLLGAVGAVAGSMASMIYPLINGRRFEWASVEFRIAGAQQKGLVDVSYGASLDPQQVYGASSRKPIGRTGGIAKFEASLTFLKEEGAAFIAGLGPKYGLTSFDIVISYAEGAVVTTDTILGARLKKDDNAHKQSADALTTKLDLDVMDVLHNGMSIA